MFPESSKKRTSPKELLSDANFPNSVEGKEDQSIVEEIIESFGKCKWFNIEKGYGFITTKAGDESENDIFVYQSKIQMPGFRSLTEGERVKILYKQSSLGWEAIKVTSPTGEDCKGFKKRLKRKKGADKCYNCSENGHHAKECKAPPLPKRCHHCKSVEHLVSCCPSKHEFQESKSRQ